MIEITPKIGLAVSLFLFMVSITYYRYYKSLFRLVYSTGKICLSCKELGDWSKEGNLFKTRVLFYNNGRKTLNKKVIPFLSIESKTQDILSATILNENNTELNISNEKVELNLDYLDSKDFIVTEIEHYGNIEVIGRIDESGKILNTESKTWLIINSIIFLIIMGLMFTSVFSFYSAINSLNNLIPFIYIILSLMIIYRIVRFLHSIFFIPDRIVSKYLDTKNKLSDEFSK